MASYLSSLLTSTTSRYNNLRRSLLSDESDGDTENDSHVSRVLRAYYTEKGRPFPTWLPPDSSRPQPAPSSSYSYSHSQAQRPQATPRRSGALSDLWADPPPQQTPLTSTPSLRTGRSTLGATNRAESYGFGAAVRGSAPAGARPLPSQREGSQQSNAFIRQESSRNSIPTPGPTPGGGVTPGGGTAQDKLKARLWGAGRP